jgi:hypothetical protein
VKEQTKVTVAKAEDKKEAADAADAGTPSAKGSAKKNAPKK